MSKGVTIELTVTITGAEDWSVDWEDEWAASEQLSELRSDVKSAIASQAGIDRQCITVTSREARATGRSDAEGSSSERSEENRSEAKSRSTGPDRRDGPSEASGEGDRPEQSEGNAQKQEAMTYSKDKVRTAADKFIHAAYAAKDHLSVANYRERDAEATGWLEKAEEELRAALLDAPEGEGRDGPQWVSVEQFDKLKRHAEEMADALEYLAFPVLHTQKRLKEGERLNGLHLAGVSERLAPFTDKAAFPLNAYRADFPAPQASLSTDTKEP